MITVPPQSPQSATAAAKPSLQPESLQAARTKIIQHWVRKVIPVAIALGALPILGIGVLNFSAGHQILKQANSAQLEPPVKQTAQSWLTLLLLGASATALLTGGLAWLWLKVFVNALVKQSTQLVAQADQFQLSESLQNLGYTIGLLQEQDSVDDILQTATLEVRSLLNADRAIVFYESAESIALRQETIAAGETELLKSDLSHLPIPLEDILRVPMGYVQVCSEVQGSDLPQQHQAILGELGVQAQMVTQITLDNESKGILVVQCNAPRDWTSVEHQLFAAIAKQIAIAVDRKLAGDRQRGASPTLQPSSPSSVNGAWSDYYDHCFQLSQASAEQADQLRQVMEQMQAGLDQSQRLSQGLQQVQDHIQNHTHMLKTSETAVNRSVTSITQMQETLAQSSHSSQQLVALGQKMAQASVQIKELADRVNYQAMNASITAKKQASLDQSWSLEFTNEILQLTRELTRQTQELDVWSTQILTESHTLESSADVGSEQLLVSSEWFRDSRQQWNQMLAVNGQLESSLRRLMDNHQAREKNAALSHQQMLELAHWLNQTVEESSAMVQSIEQMTSPALA